MESKNEKWLNAVTHLKEALTQYTKGSTDLNFLALVKAFEITIEYAWRDMKRLVEDQGLEAQSPKMAVKTAAKLGLITAPETWLECINARNNSVHDYFGITNKEFTDLAKELIALIDQSEIFKS